MQLRSALRALSTVGLAAAAHAQTIVLQDGQPVGGVGNVSGISRLAVNDGGSWLVEVDTDAPVAADIVMLLDGVVVAQEAQPLSAPPGATLGSFNAISLDAAGNSAWNLFLDNTVGTNDDSGVYWNTELVVGESQFSVAPQFTAGTQYKGFFDARINALGDVLIVASVDDPNIPTTIEHVLVKLDVSPIGTLLSESVAAMETGAPASLGGDSFTDFETGSHSYDYNALGQAAYIADVTTGFGGNAAIMRDSALVARVGGTSPLAGRTWESVLGRPLSLDGGGALLFRANVSGSTTDDERLWLRSAGGTITSVASEGDAVSTPDGAFLISSFGTSAPIELSDNGDVLYFADLDDPDTTRDAVLIRNGSVLVQEGRTTVAGTLIQSIAGTAEQFAMSPNGRFVLLECKLDGGADAVVLIDTENFGTFCDASDGSLVHCPCGNPGLPSTGCDNAQATGGVSLSILAQTTSPNGATLQGLGFPSASAPTAIVLRSNALDPASPVAFGDGLRCVHTLSLVRLAATVASSGTSAHVIGHAPAAGPGTFVYQVWYRNTPSTFCDAFAAYNLSSGVRLGW